MPYTDTEYLNRIIEGAVQLGVLTEEEAVSVASSRGSNHEMVAVDVLSLVYQRCSNKNELNSLQAIFRARNQS